MYNTILELVQKGNPTKEDLDIYLKVVKSNISEWYALKDLIEKKGGVNNAQTQTF